MKGAPITKYQSVKEYLTSLPEKDRGMLEELRKTIKRSAPEAQELISYNMPAFRYHGMLVFYAAFKEHIGFYPGNAVVNIVFKDELANFVTSKGTIKFSKEKPLPLSLVEKIVQYRVKENLEKVKVNKEK